MLSHIDFERLIMSGVLIGALILWGGIIAESSGLHPNAKVVATSVLGMFITVFTAAVLILSHFTRSTAVRSDAKEDA